MEEYVDVLDEDGFLTGRTILKSIAHRDGVWHPCVHIWIYNDKGEILMQKRAMTKAVYPGVWDISAAGHVAAGETMEEAALREIKEELGKDEEAINLKEIFIYKASHNTPEGLKIREFYYIFLLRCNDPIESFTKQDEEVDDLKFISITNLRSDLDSFYVKNYAYRGPYYDKVLEAIASRL